jgi:F-type H+-transporting ATPase subunit delta
MKNLNVLAMRYSKALFAIAKKEAIVEQVLADFKQIDDGLIFIKDKSNLFLSSIMPYRIKIKLWGKLLSILKLTSLTEDFVYLLLHNNRIGLFLLIKNCLSALYREEKGVLLAEVFSAIELNSKLKQGICDELSKLFGKKIELEAKVKEKILGGLVIKVGSKMIDTSIESKLNSLKHRINTIRVTS